MAEDGAQMQRSYDEQLTREDCDFLGDLGIRNSIQSARIESSGASLWQGLFLLLSGLIALGFWIRYLVQMW